MNRLIENPLFTELDRLGTLPKGWNGYSAPTASERAIEHAKELLLVAHEEEMLPDRVEPSAMGGVGMTFGGKDSREVLVEFYNNGKIHALFADDSTHEMRTEAVENSPQSFLTFLGEVDRFNNK